ncbi:DNA double-strand break repair nuclease NurA [Helicobacter salomonis]|uniref:DNA double-strand break repair nuclease NurA n=1 Tax=Helicobacter salomonis TaxID=56878 RepID=UPI000CF0590F|nr:DNA double-strand break repair nuclease NurA [Helicobacter salomonis]
MGYRGERASKINHQHIVENEKVKAYLTRCGTVDNALAELDCRSVAIDLSKIQNQALSQIERLIVVDGGYQEVCVDDKFPSKRLCYYNVGILTFSLKDLKSLAKQQSVNPDDLGRLEKDFQRFSFVFSIQGYCHDKKDFITTTRERLYEIFRENSLNEDDDSLLNTLKWLVFQEYKGRDGSIEIACAGCGSGHTFMKKQGVSYKDLQNDSLDCSCGAKIYITDCFELHTLVDEILGAGAIESYVMRVFEVVLMLSVFRFLIETSQWEWLSKILFIQDGPLALFSRLDDFAFKVVRVFLQYLYDRSLKDNASYVNWIGLDKSGLFVDHLQNLEYKIPAESLVLPNSAYIKKYITGDTDSIFGLNTYFGIKMLVKSDRAFVLNVAVPFGLDMTYQHYLENPNIEDFLALKNILEILKDLRCDMYQQSFVPVVMLNKLVSISDKPGQRILKSFSLELLDRTTGEQGNK